MKRYTYRPWPMLTYPQLPDYLETMERKGLRFHHITGILFLAAFEKIPLAQRPLPGYHTAYCWDYMNSTSRDEIESYLTLCEGTGWEIAWQFGKHKIFRSDAARRPAPLWSPGEYGQLLRRRGARPQLLWGMGILPLWLLFTWLLSAAFRSFAITPFAGQGFMILSHLFFLLTITGLFWSGIENLQDARSYRKDREKIQREEEYGREVSKKILTARSCLSFFTMLAGGGAIVFLVISTALFYSSSMMGVLLLFTYLPFAFWNAYACFSELRAYTKKSREKYREPMKGTSPNSGRIAAALLIMVIAVALSGIYYGMEVAPQALRTSNLYCREIRTDQRMNVIANAHYEVRSEKDVDKVLNGVFKREFISRPEEPISSGEKDKLEGMLENERLFEILVDGDWDQVYDAGMFYLVVRRGNEIWCVLRLNESELQGAEFMKATGF